MAALVATVDVDDGEPDATEGGDGTLGEGGEVGTDDVDLFVDAIILCQ